MGFHPVSYIFLNTFVFFVNMKLRSDQLDIPAEKLTEYLLTKKEKNDKSKFLISIGYSLENWRDLLNDIKQIAVNNDLVLERKSEFGNLYSIKVN